MESLRIMNRPLTLVVNIAIATAVFTLSGCGSGFCEIEDVSGAKMIFNGPSTATYDTLAVQCPYMKISYMYQFAQASTGPSCESLKSSSAGLPTTFCKDTPYFPGGLHNSTYGNYTESCLLTSNNTNTIEFFGANREYFSQARFTCPGKGKYFVDFSQRGSYRLSECLTVSTFEDDQPDVWCDQTLDFAGVLYKISPSMATSNTSTTTVAASVDSNPVTAPPAVAGFLQGLDRNRQGRAGGRVRFINY